MAEAKVKQRSKRGQVTCPLCSPYELKRELDRLGVFAEYEDRFLDLFKPGDKS